MTPPEWKTTVHVKLEDGTPLEMEVVFQGAKATLLGNTGPGRTDMLLKSKKDGRWTWALIMDGKLTVDAFEEQKPNHVLVSDAVEASYQAYLAAIIVGKTDDN